MKKYFLVVSMVFAVSSYSISQVIITQQESRRIDQSIFGVGFSAGVASGFGLSFRHHLPGRFSYQLVGGIIKADSKTHYDFGGELQYDLISNEITRFEAVGAWGYFFSGEHGANNLSGPFRSALGIGVERGSERGLNLGAELLFTFFSDGTILPLPQVNMHYYFF